VVRALEHLASGGGVVTPASAPAQASATERLAALIGEIPDPEIPVLTVADLGILRSVRITADGHLVVEITPTYSGCPAIDPIRTEVHRVLGEAGYPDAEVRLQLAPAWSTDWISEEGRRKLAQYGIAPPDAPAHGGCALLDRPVRCPRCGSTDTREISRFGATPCQAQHVCNGCLEPFDRFKTLR
jgi:ring-1,2-phenylacetyl-CoA epoxidase subunit PaaD